MSEIELTDEKAHTPRETNWGAVGVMSTMVAGCHRLAGRFFLVRRLFVLEPRNRMVSAPQIDMTVTSRTTSDAA